MYIFQIIPFSCSAFKQKELEDEGEYTSFRIFKEKMGEKAETNIFAI